MKNDANFGNEIRRARLKKELEQQVLAKKLKVSKQFMFQIESGERSLPVKMIKSLSKILDLDEDFLIIGVWLDRSSKMYKELRKEFKAHGLKLPIKGE